MLNNSVVHHPDLSAAIAMWVSIFFRRPSVRRPACVPNAVGTFDRGFGDGFFQVPKLACGATDFQLAVLGDYRDAGGVIAAVFEFPQPLDDYRNNFFRPDITDNAAHERGSYLYFKVNMRKKCQTKSKLICRE